MGIVIARELILRDNCYIAIYIYSILYLFLFEATYIFANELIAACVTLHIVRRTLCNWARLIFWRSEKSLKHSTRSLLQARKSEL